MAGRKSMTQANLKQMVSLAGRQVSNGRTKQKKPAGHVSNRIYQQLKRQIDEHGKTIQHIPIEMINLGSNIRENYDSEKLKVLANSLDKDGLIQYPTLCLSNPRAKKYEFVCRNGHRRILAAKALGWKTIEAVVLPFNSVRDELYHSINANIREDVFYLDLAHAYEQAHQLGESDKDIAGRVGMNDRTIGWYRRLTKMSLSCQKLCRQYPEKFNATWAIKLARQGELPEGRKLESIMIKLLKGSFSDDKVSIANPKRGYSSREVRAARSRLEAMASERSYRPHRTFTTEFLDRLVTAGYLSKASWNRIQKDFLSHQKEGALSKRSASDR
jgi:ParB/RepB/Spo0J family partition protein